MYTVKKLSAISGVSVRTLQHYDNIGLFEPSRIGENGYRYYDEDKILELQQILFFKELDFPLSEIKEIMDDPNFSIEESLLKQREFILLKRERLNKIVKLIDKTIKNRKGEIEMKKSEYFEELNDEKIKEYTKRAGEQWGEITVNESLKNVKRIYGNDYSKIGEQFSNWLDNIKNNMNKGFKSPEVYGLIDEWFRIMNTIFPCDLDTFSGLGKTYRDCEEFAVNFRKADEKMPGFVCDAIQYYCSENRKIDY